MILKLFLYDSFFFYRVPLTSNILYRNRNNKGEEFYGLRQCNTSTKAWLSFLVWVYFHSISIIYNVGIYIKVKDLKNREPMYIQSMW